MTNSVKYLFFLGALHHLRYIEYVCRYFNVLEKDLILYFFLNEHQTHYIPSTYNSFQNTRVLDEVSFFSKKSSLVASKKFIGICEKDFELSDYIKLFSTISYDYSMIFKSNFNKTEIYLLDDGFGFFSNINYFNNKKVAIFLRYILLSILTLRWISSPFNFKYFTEYNYLDGSNNKILHYQKQKIDFNKAPIDYDRIIVLGTTEVELNLVSKDIYFNFIKSILNKYKTAEIIYYSHRKESQSKLNQIQNLGLSVAENKEPFESHLLKCLKVPEFIIGFMSSNAVYELLSKINCKSTFVLIDNLDLQYNIPHVIKSGIANCYNNYTFTKHTVN
jgi:hypothetical protein